MDNLKSKFISQAETYFSGRNFFFFLFFIVSCSLLWSVFIEKHLSADGVYYFCYILDNRDFTYIDWSRQHANYLIEWLVLLGVKSGIKDVRILSWLFGAGIYLMFLFSFLLCNAVLPKKDKVLLIFPIASMIAFNMSGDYILIGEHHAMELLSWPILFLVRRDDLGWMKQFLLWALLIVYSCLHQSAVFTGLIFLGFVVLRLIKARDRRLILRNVITGMLCLAVIGIAMYTIIYPRSEANKDSFISAIPIAIFSRDVMIQEVFLLLFAIALFIKNKKFVYISLAPILFYLIMLFYVHQGATAYQSFASRTLSMSVLPVMIIFSLVFTFLKLQITKRAAIVFSIYSVVMVSGNIYYSREWIDFKDKFIQTMESNKGFVPIEKTELSQDKLDWNWNNSLLGIVWSPSCVKSIILNQPDLIWEPFNPKKKLILKDNVKYDPIFLAVDKDITVCKTD